MIESIVLEFAAATTPWTSSYILTPSAKLSDVYKTGTVEQHMEHLNSPLLKTFDGHTRGLDTFFKLVEVYKDNRIWFITHPLSWIRDLIPYLDQALREQP